MRYTRNDVQAAPILPIKWIDLGTTARRKYAIEQEMNKDESRTGQL